MFQTSEKRYFSIFQPTCETRPPCSRCSSTSMGSRTLGGLAASTTAPCSPATADWWSSQSTTVSEFWVRLVLSHMLCKEVQNLFWVSNYPFWDPMMPKKWFKKVVYIKCVVIVDLEYYRTNFVDQEYSYEKSWKCNQRFVKFVIC